MFQCFSGLYSALFDKSWRKKPNIIHWPAGFAAGKNKTTVFDWYLSLRMKVPITFCWRRLMFELELNRNWHIRWHLAPSLHSMFGSPKKAKQWEGVFCWSADVIDCQKSRCDNPNSAENNQQCVWWERNEIRKTLDMSHFTSAMTRSNLFRTLGFWKKVPIRRSGLQYK